MGERPTPSITSYFASLEDPRSDHTRRHKLIDIMTIAILWCHLWSGQLGRPGDIRQLQGRVAEGISGVAQRHPFP